MTILVVDDDLLAAEMTSAILEASGYRTLIAENAIDGMEQLNQHSDIVMVISDLNMPLVSGIDFFRELREQGNQLPFIVLTGDQTDSLLQSNPDLDDCLIKDFDLADTLPRTVGRILQS